MMMTRYALAGAGARGGAKATDLHRPPVKAPSWLDCRTVASPPSVARHL